MPIKWTPELDAILLHGVFEECNISFSKTLCAKIAERVTTAGMECTPKAVENRLYSWKKKNVSGNTGLNASTPMKTTPAKTATPKARAKATPKAKKKSLSEEDVSDGLGPQGLMDDEEEELLSPSAARGKRGVRKRNYVESEAEEDVEEEYVPLGKRVEKESVQES